LFGCGYAALCNQHYSSGNNVAPESHHTCELASVYVRRWKMDEADFL
jgi:hypothetical protein